MDRKFLVCVMALTLSGFLGGIFSDQVLRPHAVQAAEDASNRMRNIYDGDGHRRIDLGMDHNQTLQDFFGPDGRLRIQLATYDGSVREDEKGLPCVTLYDNSGKLKLLFRLDGPNQDPLIIMKDNTGTNRMIMGLDIWDKAEEPFIVTWDKSGQQHDVVGHFVMKPL